MASQEHRPWDVVLVAGLQYRVTTSGAERANSVGRIADECSDLRVESLLPRPDCKAIVVGSS